MMQSIMVNFRIDELTLWLVSLSLAVPELYHYMRTNYLFLSLCNKLNRLLTLPVIKISLFIVICLASGLKAQAQFNSDDVGYGEAASRYGIKFGVATDIPLGKLKDIYKPGTSIDGNFLTYWGNFTFSAGIGYRSFSPKHETEDLIIDDGSGYYTNAGSITYQSFSSVILAAGAVYNFNLSRRAVLFAGLNAGQYFSSYGYSVTSTDGSYNEEGSTSVESQSYIAPKLGLGFKLSGNFQLDVEARYNVFFTPLNYNYDFSTGSSSSSGTVYNSFAAGVSLSYRFP